MASEAPPTLLTPDASPAADWRTSVRREPMKMARKTGQVIRASELGEYAYCARAWWLGRVLGYRPTNLEELAAGEAAHVRHGQTVVSSCRLQQWAYVLLALAMLVGMLFLVLALRG